MSFNPIPLLHRSVSEKRVRDNSTVLFVDNAADDGAERGARRTRSEHEKHRKSVNIYDPKYQLPLPITLGNLPSSTNQVVSTAAKEIEKLTSQVEASKKEVASLKAQLEVVRKENDENTKKIQKNFEEKAQAMLVNNSTANEMKSFLISQQKLMEGLVACVSGIASSSSLSPPRLSVQLPSMVNNTSDAQLPAVAAAALPVKKSLSVGFTLPPGASDAAPACAGAQDGPPVGTTAAVPPAVSFIPPPPSQVPKPSQPTSANPKHLLLFQIEEEYKCIQQKVERSKSIQEKQGFYEQLQRALYKTDNDLQDLDDDLRARRKALVKRITALQDALKVA